MLTSISACRPNAPPASPRDHSERRGKFSDVITISQRPAVVEDRAVPGHWEGDLILGSRGTSAIGTLVERSTRFTICCTYRPITPLIRWPPR